MKGVASEAAQGPFTVVAVSTAQPTSSPGQDRRTAGATANAGGGKGHWSVPCWVMLVASGSTTTGLVTMQKRLLISVELVAIPIAPCG